MTEEEKALVRTLLAKIKALENRVYNLEHHTGIAAGKEVYVREEGSSVLIPVMPRRK